MQTVPRAVAISADTAPFRPFAMRRRFISDHRPDARGRRARKRVRVPACWSVLSAACTVRPNPVL